MGGRCVVISLLSCLLKSRTWSERELLRGSVLFGLSLYVNPERIYNRAVEHGSVRRFSRHPLHKQVPPSLTEKHKRHNDFQR